ncbi:DUF2924 domain-containing protein [Sphingorhabdus sp.]|jgi:hypothetical protein|uniref:DUF2924 domain-containing protein n=1 Tax=Sphingorhabdus sp. TaxID=1902408 RepID=UPI0040485FD7
MTNSVSLELARLATMKPAELRSRWHEVYRNVAPNISPDLLRRGIAYRLQEKVYGKLPSYIKRELDRLNGKGGTSAPTPSRLGPILPGTRFVREWNGKTIAVTATEGGFEWDNDTYGSLSEIARKVTGAHWSGPRFFGLAAKVA